MREVNIKEFVNFDDAIYWIDDQIYNCREQTDIKIEIVHVNGKWRASYITNTAQFELLFGAAEDG